MMLYLDPAGDIRPCCHNHLPLGNIGHTRLPDIWWGRTRSVLEERIAAHDFSLGCMQCSTELDVEGSSFAYPSNFDVYRPKLTPGAESRWPLRMEFNLSNACNLQCVQCNGLLSSAIRIHRDRLPALPPVYDDRFFEDLEPFLPHLVDAQFAGGEPFLSTETRRVWDLVRRTNPGLRCTVVTNATQWNPKVRRLIDDLNMRFVFSIDDVAKDRYESIRIGADLDAVLANVDRYATAASRKGLSCEVNWCLMRQNHAGLADVLRWAEGRELRVNLIVVRDPPSCSLAAASDHVLHEALRLYESQHDAVTADLHLNLPAWTEAVERVRRWTGAGDAVTERRRTRAARASTAFRVATGVRIPAQVHLDQYGRIVSLDDGFDSMFGPRAQAIIGEDASDALNATIEQHFGPSPTSRTLISVEDVHEVDVLVGDRALRILATPLTDGGTEGGTLLRILEIGPSEIGVPFLDASDLTG